MPSAKAEEIENCFQALGRLLSAVRRAKYADAIARSELGHQGEQRDKVRQIDVHGQFRQAKSQAERLLETMETASRKLVLSLEREFRQQEVALLEGRIKASGSIALAWRFSSAMAFSIRAPQVRVRSTKSAMVQRWMLGVSYQW